ncbi:MAG: PEP-CTERM system histidine kinase PrsK, partial [Gammaproteobacteria bacterium]|nr:PEP-CTERM system histidine kinase PrsK [Gammaproteobacteria bacterium]
MNFPVASSLFGSAAFGFLAVLLAFGFRGSRPSLLLLAGSVLSCLWLGAAAWYYRSTLDIVSVTGLQLLELTRDAAWLALLGYLLTHHVSAETRTVHRRVTLFGLSATGLIALYILVSRFGPLRLSNYAVASMPALVGYLAIAVVGLVLIEQLFRNTAASARWRIKYLCFGLGGLFTYDFYMYADALLFQRINPDLWIARGFVNAVAMPMIALAAARNPTWDTNLFVSRRVVFHSSAILTAGAYLMLMAAAGYYIRSFGGTWGGAIQIALLFSGVLILVVLLFSGQLRTGAKRFIAKHFYRNKYEYGEEWLRFTSRLSSAGMQAGAVREAIIEGVAEILDSPGGVLWERTDSGRLAVTMRWNTANHGETSLALEDPFFVDMETRARVIDLVSEARTRDVHSATIIPQELTRSPRSWLVVPIMQRDSLLGLVVLNEPSLSGPITAEDIELLRIVGRQAASYLALLEAQERLSDARQFEAFNQLSAFLVHDLKNVVAQLNLIDKNAERHRHNDEFLDDVF